MVRTSETQRARARRSTPRNGSGRAAGPLEARFPAIPASGEKRVRLFPAHRADFRRPRDALTSENQITELRQRLRDRLGAFLWLAANEAHDPRAHARRQIRPQLCQRRRRAREMAGDDLGVRLAPERVGPRQRKIKNAAR